MMEARGALSPGRMRSDETRSYSGTPDCRGLARARARTREPPAQGDGPALGGVHARGLIRPAA